jgi:hypothetical protein
MGGNYVVEVQVYHLEPVAQRLGGRLVFFIQHEENKVFVVHFIFLLAFELSWHLVKNSIYCLSRERMAFITGEVLLIDKEVVICVKFPESAVKHVKVLVGEILSDNIYIAFVGDLDENIVQVGQLEVSPSDLTIVIRI